VKDETSILARDGVTLTPGQQSVIGAMIKEREEEMEREQPPMMAMSLDRGQHAGSSHESTASYSERNRASMIDRWRWRSIHKITNNPEGELERDSACYTLKS